MKKFKKLFAVILSLAMVLGMSLTSFAAPAPTSMPKNTVTVKNVAEGSTVTAYKIVEYKLEGKYTEVVTGAPSNMEQPSAEDILKIANDAKAGKYGTGEALTGKTIADAETGKDIYVYQKDLEAGMWIVLVKSSGDTIYNPMIVSINVGPDGASTGVVDANGNFMEGNNVIYAKHSTANVEKKVTDPAYELNDDIEFTVTATIPEYSSNYEAVIYKLNDTLSEELEYVQTTDTEKKTTVTVDGKPYTVTPSYTVDEAGRNTMEIVIDSKTVMENTGKTVVLKYYAHLTDSAKQDLATRGSNVNPTTNKVVLTYSNNPYDSTEVTTKEDDTHHYTFGIDASVLGANNKQHENFVKTGPNQVDKVTGEKIPGSGEPLAGAEFELVKKDESGNYVKIPGINNVLSDSNGLTKFVGLDANTTYYLHEVKAPQGYSVINKYVPVYIDAKFNDDGSLKDGWTITIGEKVSDDVDETTLTGKYNWGTLDGVTEIVPANPNVPAENPYKFENTNLAELPSTGGIGTTIFTIGGCLIMVVAAALFFASRRKSAK